MRPAIYSTSLSRSELAAEFARTQDYLIQAKRPRDPDLEVLAAMVTWNSYPDQTSELLAANLCASAIAYVRDNAIQERSAGFFRRVFRRAKPPTPTSFALLPLAVHYLGFIFVEPNLRRAVRSFARLNKGC